MRTLLHTCCLAGALLIGWPAAASDENQGGPQASWEQYQVLVERNIFSRQRGRVSEPRLDTTPPPAAPPERYVVLKGVLKRGDQHTAFLENVRTGIVTRARAGDAVLDGQVQSITLDGIEYVKNDSTAAVRIGQNLEGGQSTAVPSGGGEPGTTSSGAAGTGEAADILERLRQRREEEMRR